MKRIWIYLLLTAFGMAGCKKEQKHQAEKVEAPEVTQGGARISFREGGTSAFFETESIGNSHLAAELNAPARVAAIVTSSREGGGPNLIIFDDPELTSNYTQLLTHRQEVSQLQGILKQKQALIVRKNNEVARFEDLFKNGAGTGKDVSDAQVDVLSAETEMAIVANQLESTRTAILEHEARLKTAGFDPALLRAAKPGTAIVIGEVTEDQVGNIKEGGSCSMKFNAYPNEVFNGKIEDIADLIDQTSQMVKIRIGLNNSSQKFKAGMFANVALDINQGEKLSIPKSALITVQGKNYVFVRSGKNEFDRKEVVVGKELGDRIVVFSGLTPGEQVVKKGVMQLKGLSFGY